MQVQAFGSAHISLFVPCKESVAQQVLQTGPGGLRNSGVLSKDIGLLSCRHIHALYIWSPCKNH